MPDARLSPCLSVPAPGAPDRQTPSSLMELARKNLKGRKKDATAPLQEPAHTACPSVLEWFRVALDEGHIEPSQPSVGKMIGWPQRSYALRSLLVDFQGWSMRQGLPEVDGERDRGFRRLVAEIFQLEGDRVSFPPLKECRQRFQRRNP